MKKAQIGVPEPQLWEDLGYSPLQIARFKKLREEEPPMATPPYPPSPPPPSLSAFAEFFPDTGNNSAKAWSWSSCGPGCSPS